MTEVEELRRLLDADDVPAELQEGLRGLRAHVATPAQMAALSDRLGVDRMPLGSASAPAAAKTAALTKALLGAGAVAGAVALVLLLRSGNPEKVQGSEKATAVASTSANPSVEESTASGATGRSFAPPSGVPSTTLPAEPSTDTKAAESPKPAGTKAGTLVESQRASPGDERKNEIDSSRSAPAERTPSKSVVPGGSSRAVAPEQRPSGTSEIELLRNARATLPVDPAEALAITERHRSAFPRGALAQEREILAITALVKLGRSDAATKRAEQFRSAYPKSAYLIQLERILPKH